MPLAIETTGLGFAFGGRPILADLDLAVAPGEVFGVLGPNGAGKTTTVRLLNGLLAPTAGRARVLGLDPATQGHAVRARTGVLTEGPALYERLAGRANLAYFAALADMPLAGRAAAVDRALARVGLTSRADDLAGTYSKGMQQRLAIARAILHEPELLFLDEPTAALDPESAARVTDLVTAWRAAGRTVFLATHHLGNAERLCDRFAFFARGRVMAVGTRAELAARGGTGPAVAVGLAGEAPRAIAWPPGCTPVAVPGGFEVGLPALAATPAVVRACVEGGCEVLRVVPVEPTLEELYFAIVGRQEP